MSAHLILLILLTVGCEINALNISDNGVTIIAHPESEPGGNKNIKAIYIPL